MGCWKQARNRLICRNMPGILHNNIFCKNTIFPNYGYGIENFFLVKGTVHLFGKFKGNK